MIIKPNRVNSLQIKLISLRKRKKMTLKTRRTKTMKMKMTTMKNIKILYKNLQMEGLRDLLKRLVEVPTKLFIEESIMTLVEK